MPHRLADPATLRTLLILKPSSLGDIVHTLPAVSLLKAAYPDVRFRWLVNPEWTPLLEGNPDIAEIIPFPRRELGGAHRIFRQLGWLRKLRARYRSDLVLDFQGLLRSAIIGSACRGQRLLGLSDSREGSRYFYDQTASVAPGEHSIDRYLRLAALAGATLPPPGDLLPCPLPAGERPEGFSLSEPFLLLHPFSRGKGKSMTLPHLQALCATLPCPVVIAGKADGITLPEMPRVTNLLNATSLSGLIWLLRQAQAVISVDSGPMHIASALGKPLIGIHTWSDPAKVGPHHPEAWILKEGELYQRRSPGQRRQIRSSEALAEFTAQELLATRPIG